MKSIVGAARNQPADVRVALYVFLGRIQRERLGALDEAATSRRAHARARRAAALDPLIDILRQRGDAAALAEALRKRGSVVTDVVERRAAYAEVAQLCERAGDTKGAIAAWREIVDNDDSDRAAFDQLARIYRVTGSDKAALVEVLIAAARLATSGSDEKNLRFEIARLESDGPRAVASWQAVIDLDPDDLEALRALEGAHAKNGVWMAVSDSQMRRLDLAKTSADKVAIHAEMARLAETRRQSVDDAITSWYAALEIDNAHQPAYVELERLLGAASRWHDLVELLERLAELYGTLGDGHAEIQALARAADVWEGKLDSPDAAGEILEKILKREPGSVAALTRLSKIYERAGDWTKCKATLEQALKLSPTGRDAADLFFRLGEVAREGDSDDATAILHYQQALKHMTRSRGVDRGAPRSSRAIAATTRCSRTCCSGAWSASKHLSSGSPCSSRSPSSSARPAATTRRSPRSHAPRPTRRATSACSARSRICTSPPAGSTRPRRSTTGSPTRRRPRAG